MKRLLAPILALALLTGCAPAQPVDGALHVLCTTYPVYLLTASLAQDAEGVQVELLVNQQTSCLHDYTLTVKDMRAIERADIIVMNGAGLEDFMADALAQSDAAVIDCSESVKLLPLTDGHDHGHREDDHEEESDPHYWMDPHRAGQMAEHIAAGLCELDPDRADVYRENGAAALSALSQADPFYRDAVFPAWELITFHDGFQYFADAFGLTILKSIEEEEGAEASAKELEEIIDLVKTHRIPAIFVEKNGSRRSADVIARETGCKVYELDMLMSGEGRDIQAYLDGLRGNLTAIMEALG